jgi:hypothetical protein
MLLELQIDRAKTRYRVRTLAGDGVDTEIWTLLEACGRQRGDRGGAFICPSAGLKGWPLSA